MDRKSGDTLKLGSRRRFEPKEESILCSYSLNRKIGKHGKTMHRDFNRADGWVPLVIGAAIEIHREKGPGLLEGIYQKCLGHEFVLRRIPAVHELTVPITYKGFVFDEPLRLDLFVDRCLIVEVKAVERILPIHVAQLLSYMRLLDAPIGLLVNFHEMILKDGIRRLTLKGANRA